MNYTPKTHYEDKDNDGVGTLQSLCKRQSKDGFITSDIKEVTCEVCLDLLSKHFENEELKLLENKRQHRIAMKEVRRKKKFSIMHYACNFSKDQTQGFTLCDETVDNKHHTMDIEKVNCYECLDILLTKAENDTEELQSRIQKIRKAKENLSNQNIPAEGA